jgi:hypothetical protein
VSEAKKPWERVPCAGCDEGFHMAPCGNAEADARLRAVQEAAPELYRALERIMSADETGHLVWGTTPTYRIQTMELAKAAMRKARGE